MKYMSLLLVAAVAASALAYIPPRDIRPRVIEGTPDVDDEYPYVVALITTNSAVMPQYLTDLVAMRICTGSLISSQWVLTGAHCIKSYITRVRYGNLTGPASDHSALHSEVLQYYRHPYFKTYGTIMKPKGLIMNYHDIGLLFIKPVKLAKYGKISAVDSLTLMGMPLRYIGTGMTRTSYGSEERMRDAVRDQERQRQIGEAIAAPCSYPIGHNIVMHPLLCFAPKCANRNQRANHGDTGGPVIHAGKIVGVLMSFHGYTPVSYYLHWIHSTVSKQHR